MKRLGNLYDKIISLDNLRLADERARKGKLRSYGVKLHDRNKEANLLSLHEALKAGTYRTSEYSTFTIYEPKEREIFRLPYFPDRIVHHAVMNILEPIWVSIFTADTYSCIKGRGIQAAANKLRRVIDRDKAGCAYCLKIDIRKFYPSIDHTVLKSIVRRKIKDTRLLNLLDEIIDSAEGLPIGNYLSQYLANLVLTYFDHWVKEVKRVRYYFRYADDIVVLHSDKKTLHALLAEFESYLAANVKLEIKQNKQVFPVAHDHRDSFGRGIDFLGYVFYLNETRLRKRIKQNLCRKIAKLRKRKKPLSEDEFKQTLAAWWGWAKYSDSEYLINKLNKIHLMKSSSDVRPAIILPLGNGSYHYNYNIVEEKVEDPETGEKTVYNYDTVQVWQKPDYENLTRAVIRSEIDETEEFSLINDYYAAQLGIETDEDRKAKAVADYKAHLSRVIAIKTMVKNDLLTEGY